jgi:hypothetical protein
MYGIGILLSTVPGIPVRSSKAALRCTATQVGAAGAWLEVLVLEVCTGLATTAWAQRAAVRAMRMEFDIVADDNADVDLACWMSWSDVM